MKIFSTLIIALLIIFQTVGFAASETFSASGEYLMSDYDTPEIAEEIALDFAKQNAAEQAGIYLESYSRSIDSQIDELEIKTVASSKVEVLDKNITRQNQAGGRILLRANIRATVDTSELDNFLAQTRQERQQAIQRYKALQEMNNKIKQDIDEFQSKLTAIKDEVKDDDLIVEQERINREFLSNQQMIFHPDKAIELNPKNALAYASYQVVKISDTATEYSELLKDFEENRDKNFPANTKNLTKAMILEPTDSTFPVLRGLTYVASGSNYEGIVALKQLHKQFHNLNEDFMQDINQAKVLKLQDYNRALADYTKAIELAPRNGSAYRHRGHLYKELERYSEAVEDYRLALKVDEKNFDMSDYMELRDVCEKLKNYPFAIEAYTKVIESPTKFVPSFLTYAYNFRALCYIETDEYDKAIVDCDKGLELAITNYDISRFNDLKEKAVRLKKLADEGDLSDPNALIERAKKYSKERMYKRAVEDYTKALALDPKNQDALINRSSIYLFDLIDYKAAIDDLNILIKLNPNSFRLYDSRGFAYEHLGDNKKALADYKKAFKLDPSKEYLRKKIFRLQDKK